MADNVSIPPNTWASRQLTVAGSPAQSQYVQIAYITGGTDNAKTWVEATGDATNGLWVNVKASALPAGAALEAGGNLAAIAAAVRAEDTASADADKGIGFLAIRKAAPANLSGADGDYEYLQVSAGRLWASATIDAALPTGANVIGAVTQSGTWNVGTVASITAALPAGTNVLGKTQLVDSASADLTTTKAVQPAGGRYVAVQEAKDSGRVTITLYATNVAPGATGVETAITLQKAADTAATSAAASFLIPNGKRWRITSVMFGTRGNGTATAQATTFSVRVNTAGAVVVTSTPIVMQARCATPATASAYDRVITQFPDGQEFLGNGAIQIGVTANAVFVTNAPTWDVLVTIVEY